MNIYVVENINLYPAYLEKLVSFLHILEVGLKTLAFWGHNVKRQNMSVQHLGALKMTTSAKQQINVCTLLR